MVARDPSMRASDAERDRVAAALQEHCAQGRLTMEEFQTRLDAVYEAKTVGELDNLTADLPEEDLYQLPVPASESSEILPRSRESVEVALPGGIWPWLWGTWAVVSALNLVVWLFLSAILGGTLPAWWIWVAGPWGVIQLGAHVADRKYGRGTS